MGNKLPKGEKGLDKAIEMNKKYAEQNKYDKYSYGLETAIRYFRDAKEDFSLRDYTSIDPTTRFDIYSTTVTYKNNERNLFVYKDENGDGWKKRDPKSKKYFVITKGENGRYEISSFDLDVHSYGTEIEVAFDIGTSNTRRFSGTKESIMSNIPEKDLKKFDSLLYWLDRLEHSQTEYLNKQAAEKSKATKGPQVEAKKEVEQEIAKEEVNAQEEEMDLNI